MNISVTSGIFAKTIFALVGSDLTAKIIAMLGGLVIARLYAPSDFGIYSSIIVAATFVSLLSLLKYDAAILSVKNDAEAEQIAAGALYVAVILSVPLSLLLGLINVAGGFLHYLQSAIFIWIISFVMSAGALYLAMVIRFNQTKAQIQYRLSMQMILLVLQIVFGALTSTSLSLIISDMIARTTAIAFQNHKNISGKIVARWISDARSNFQILKKNIEYPRYTLGAALMQFVPMFCPTIFLKIYFGAHDAGLWAMYMYFSAAYGVFSYSTTAALLGRARNAELTKDGGLMRMFNLVTLAHLAMFIVGYPLIFLIGEVSISWVLGSEWAGINDILVWMLPALFATALGAPWQLLNNAGRHSIPTFCFSLGAGVLVLGYGLSVLLQWDVKAVVIITSLSVAIPYVILYANLYTNIKSQKW